MPLSKSARNTWMMLGVAAAATSIFALGHVFLLEKRDEKTLCIPGNERGQTIVLVDRTDKWNSNQSDRLEKHILDILNVEMKQEERLWVFEFGATFSQGFKEKFTACKPPDGSNCWGIFCNQKQLKEQYETRFLPPLRDELKTLKIATAGNCSPIAEVLVEVLSRKEIKAQPGTTRVVLISDMAQNSPVDTFFRGPLQCPGVVARGDADRHNGILDYLRKHKADIGRAETTVLVLQLFPDGRTPDVGVRAKQKWEEAFRMLQFSDRWEKL